VVVVPEGGAQAVAGWVVVVPEVVASESAEKAEEAVAPEAAERGIQ
jgi:hypothetical protein